MCADFSTAPRGIVSRVHKQLQQFLDHSKAERIVVAYSGGLDSTVLLHLTQNLSAKLDCSLLAAHINHRLHPEADDWEVHCRKQAKRMGIAYQCEVVQLSNKHPQGVEAAARKLRYRALQHIMKTGDLLLTAHHQNDQAETVLLRLLRGAGITGLKAIPEYRILAKGSLARPMLSISRADIHHYAQAHRLNWLKDPSNEDLRYARNYIRHRVVPILETRWQTWHETIARAAKHQVEADTIITAETKRYLHRCLLPHSSNLLIRVLLTLPIAYRHSVLRAWCKLNEIPLPNTLQITRICNMISEHILKRNASGGGMICTYSDIGIGFYHGMLYAVKPLKRVPVSSIEWHNDKDCKIPQLNLRLRRTELMRQAPVLFDQSLIVDFRRGGERCAFQDTSNRVFHKSLKKVFQEHRIPTWQRNRIPLIYAQGRLRLVWNITACH